METRKVQKSGGTTFTVSLPKSWAREQGIEAGSVLSLQANDDGSLHVSPVDMTDRTDGIVKLDVASATEGAIRQRIRGLYAIGCESARLYDETGHTADRRQTVEKSVERLSGFELLEVTSSTMTVTTLIDADNVDIKKLTRRLKLITLSMHRDAITALIKTDESLAERVIERDAEADKLFTMVTRHFRRALSDLQESEKLGYNRDTLFEFYYTCRQFERVADHAEKIASFVTDPDAPVVSEFTDRLAQLAGDARGVIDNAADIVLTEADLNDAHAILTNRDEVVTDIESLDRQLYEHDTPEEAYVVGMVLDSVRRTAEYGANVAEIGIQQLLRHLDVVSENAVRDDTELTFD